MNVTPEPITAEQLKALRNAQSVTFRYDPATHLVNVRATIEHDPGDGFGERELSTEFPILGRVATLKSPSPIPRATVTTAYWSVLYASVDDTWRTVVHGLRAGDELIGAWTVGGGVYDKLHDAGFTTVEFRLEVVRTTAKSRKYLFHPLGYSVERLDSPLQSVCYGVTEYTLNVD